MCLHKSKVLLLLYLVMCGKNPIDTKSSSPQSHHGKKDRLRPTSLGVGSKLQTRTVPAPESFPTPMEEPRKVLRGMLVGTKQVDKPCGIDVIRAAIDELMDSVPKAEWRQVREKETFFVA